jgi:hypothetical protein
MKIEKIIITEKQLNAIKKLLLESNQVADEVFVLSTAIKEEILSKNNSKGYFTYYKRKYIYFLNNNKNSIAEINHSFNDYCFFNSIKVYYNITNFNNEKDVIKKMSNSRIEINYVYNNDDDKHIYLECAFLRLNLSTVNNKPYPENFDETIQHEVNHVYKQYLKIANVKGISKKFEHWHNIYQTAINNLNNPNQYISDLAYMYYHLSKDEQDSFTNGLYANLNGNKIKEGEIESFYKKSHQFEIIQTTKDIQKEINTWDVNNENLKIALKTFFGEHYDPKTIINRIQNHFEKNIHRFQKKIGGVLAKYRNQKSPQYQETLKNVMERFRKNNSLIY